MRSTEVLQETWKMRFEEACGGWNGGQLPLAGGEDLEAALAAAERDFQHWRRMLALDRFHIIITAATRLLRERA